MDDCSGAEHRHPRTVVGAFSRDGEMGRVCAPGPRRRPCTGQGYFFVRSSLSLLVSLAINPSYFVRAPPTALRTRCRPRHHGSAQRSPHRARRPVGRVASLCPRSWRWRGGQRRRWQYLWRGHTVRRRWWGGRPRRERHGRRRSSSNGRGRADAVLPRAVLAGVRRRARVSISQRAYLIQLARLPFCVAAPRYSAFCVSTAGRCGRFSVGSVRISATMRMFSAHAGPALRTSCPGSFSSPPY